MLYNRLCMHAKILRTNINTRQIEEKYMETVVEDGRKLYPEAEFVSGKWNQEINVRDFIQRNYTPYEGDSSFLAGPTDATKKLWNECLDLFEKGKLPLPIWGKTLYKRMFLLHFPMQFYQTVASTKTKNIQIELIICF